MQPISLPFSMEWSILSWVIHTPLLLLLICLANSEEYRVRPSLVGFLQKLSDNNTEIIQKLGWNASTDPCADGWKGVECISRTNSVYKIVLEELGLHGSIDAGLLCEAPSLAVLCLQGNAIHGELPPQISSCSQLKHLHLGGNRLSGSLPSSLALLGNLKVLNISSNNFSGELPDLAKISGLVGFLAQNNRLDGIIPSFQFRNFGPRRFNVSNNFFAGPIPRGGDRFDQSSFMDNPGLCGKPLPDACPPAPSLSLSPENGNGKPPWSSREKAVMFSGYISLSLVLLLFFTCKVIYSKKINCRKVGDEKNAPDSSVRNLITNKMETASRSEYSIPSSTETSSAMASSSLIVLKKPGTTTDLKFEDLMEASAELLGRGSYGSVYKVMLGDGTALVVKRIKNCATSAAEFRRRMQRIDMARHPNVLPAVAFYCSMEEKLVVYEYQKKGSLFNLLHGSQATHTFDWSCRLRVAAGVAEGLAFMHKELHADGIRHGNLKSSNILMNSSMDPCISEYGLIPMVDHNRNLKNSHGGCNHVHGSAGDDVYGFGVVLLELLTGRKLVHNDPLELEMWASSLAREEWAVEVFDRAFMADGAASQERMVQLLQVGLRCIHPSPVARPSMDLVATMINTIREEDEWSL